MTRHVPRLLSIAILVAACSSAAAAGGPSPNGRPPSTTSTTSTVLSESTVRTAPIVPTPPTARTASGSTAGSLTTDGYRSASAAIAPALSATGWNSYEHIFVVVFENKSYSSIVGASAAPNFNALIKKGSLATAYTGIRHPSLPNYLAMIGGSTFGITTDCSPSSCPVNSSNLGSLLSANGRTWKGYMESMPASCTTWNSGSYAVRHDPFVYFNNIRTTSLCKNVVPYTQLATDLKWNSTTPRFAFVTPNVCHDMHDCSIASGDTWLGQFSKLVMGSSAWTGHRSLLVVTFDEDDGSASNRIVTLAVGSPVGQSVKAGARSSTAYNHYNLLRTIEYYLGVPTLGRNDASRSVMWGLVPS